MPKKPKHPCGHPGCPALVEERFCPEHRKLEDARYNRYDRDPETRRRYGRAWEKMRARHLMVHPFCERCKAAGKLTPAEEVHHILPLAQGGMHDESNLMSLCTRCHSEITAREGGRWRKRRP